MTSKFSKQLNEQLNSSDHPEMFWQELFQFVEIKYNQYPENLKISTLARVLSANHSSNYLMMIKQLSDLFVMFGDLHRLDKQLNTQSNEQLISTQNLNAELEHLARENVKSQKVIANFEEVLGIKEREIIDKELAVRNELTSKLTVARQRILSMERLTKSMPTDSLEQIEEFRVKLQNELDTIVREISKHGLWREESLNIDQLEDASKSEEQDLLTIIENNPQEGDPE